MGRTVIIGLGNADRGDDGAGPLVIQCLQEAGVPARTFTGDTLALLDEWTAADDVVLIDASVSGAEPGAVTEWTPADGPLELRAAALSSHALALGQVLELARLIGRCPRSVQVYAIEGAAFSPGEPPSDEVVHSCSAVAGRILRGST